MLSNIWSNVDLGLAITIALGMGMASLAMMVLTKIFK